MSIDTAAQESHMRRCIELAREAKARGDVPVGSLVVRDGWVLAEASEQLPTSSDPIGHAEVLAVRAACLTLGTLDLSGCTLYTTAEPCFMCSYAIREAGVSLVVFGTRTAGVGGVTSSHPILTDAAIAGWRQPPQVVEGVLVEECSALRRG
jgi:tRNA(adenine34) deaminase